MSEPTVPEIRAHHRSVTPGPWGWFGNLDVQNLYLASRRGRNVVMDFVRWGAARAQPRFPVNRLMVKAVELPVFEVAPTAISRWDSRVYRADVIGVRHPDADFLARSWEYVDVLLAEVARLQAALANPPAPPGGVVEAAGEAYALAGPGDEYDGAGVTDALEVYRSWLAEQAGAGTEPAVPHTVTVSGCDDKTRVVMPLTAAEAALIGRLADAITEASETECMPKMRIAPGDQTDDDD